MARKQVERKRSDPGMFIVTYTAEHNHPMPTYGDSLPGGTRQKAAQTPSPDDPGKSSCSSEVSPAASLSPALEKLESSPEDFPEVDQDEDDVRAKNMGLEDDFSAGLEDVTAPDSGECTPSHFPANVVFPWISSSATAGGGGGG